MDHFGPENGAQSYRWICAKIFFLILHNENGEQLHGIILMIFPKKFSFVANEPFCV